MKKFVFLLFVGMILFACSNDDKESIPVQEGLVFEIAAKTQLNDTKAGPPVYSQDTAQNIARVYIMAFRKADAGTDYLYQDMYTVSGWTAGNTSATFKVLPPDNKLPAGDYQFLAFGRDATDSYFVLPVADSSTKFEDMYASITNSGDEYEIFSGTAQAQVYPEGARVSITMTRKVAGILGYFKNVPAVLNGENVASLRLTASAGNKVVNLITGVGSSAATAYEIFNIDLTTQTVVDGIYQGNDLTAAGVVKLDYSQLSGAFMLPVDGVNLGLGLYNAAGVSLKSWLIVEGVTNILNIQANHFYSLGTKHKPDTTTGIDPVGTGDDDDAIDLLQDEVITITLDPAWNTIHTLDIQ